MSVTPDGKYLVNGSSDRTIKVWNLKTNQPVFSLFGHTDTIRGLAISPDGQTLASSSRDGVRLWGLRSAALISRLTQDSDWVSSVAFSPDGKMLATGGLDQLINVWRYDGLMTLPKTSK